MVKCNMCLTSAEYIDWLVDIDAFCDEDFMLKDLPKWLKKIDYEEMWDYDIMDIDHILENKIDVVLVRFPKLYGGYEYRWCEVESDEN